MHGYPEKEQFEKQDDFWFDIFEENEGKDNPQSWKWREAWHLIEDELKKN